MIYTTQRIWKKLGNKMNEVQIKCRRTVCKNEHDNCEHTMTKELYCHSCAKKINMYNPGVISIPFFKHDCSKCIFLGNFIIPENNEYPERKYDLYFCGEGGDSSKDPSFIVKNTVIARYGSDGPEYCSGLVFADENMEYPVEELVEAKKRAIEKGIMS